MASIRRVVTAERDGKAIPVIDGDISRITESGIPGLDTYTVWATDDIPTVPVVEGGSDAAAEVVDFFPGARGSRFIVCTYPPGVGTEPYQAPESTGDGMEPNVEIDESMMHATVTVDYGIVLEGEMWLDLGHGQPEIHLRPGDCVVQNGTLHAWRNRGSDVCRMAFVIIGAQEAGA